MINTKKLIYSVVGIAITAEVFLLVSNEIDYEIDPSLSAQKRYEADILAIKLSLKNDFTEEGIKQWPVGSIKEVALKVYELSGVDDPNNTRREEMEKFRPDEQEPSN